MLIHIMTVVLAIIFSIPLWVVGLELIITLFHRQPLTNKLNSKKPVNYKILMPAHNEAAIIDKTLKGLLNQEVLPSAIIVIADNCTDSTAEIARNHKVTVLERFNDDKRGKGFALDHGLSYLKETEQPDVVIILDADCEIEANSLNLLNQQCFNENLPVQALYLMRNKKEGSLKQRVAGFAWLVKNKIRPIAVNKLGLPVTLTGTGMAFPWHVIADISVAHGNIVEDMQLGLDCTQKGFPPLFSELAVVYSDFPEQADAEVTQRTRWEHGHLMTITQQVPKLIKQGFVKKDWKLFGLALDIGVPPLSLLVMLSLIALLMFSIVAFLTEFQNALYFFLASFLFFSATLCLIWWRFGREYLSFNELLKIPLYIYSKISIYVAYIFKRQKSWVRTERDSDATENK